ncbi:hypothetical protein [Paraglaciecola aestuariivivens]
MINQLWLFVMLFAPVGAYAAGALMVSAIQAIPNIAKLTKVLPQPNYKNGH